jgi:hypothetical protein
MFKVAGGRGLKRKVAASVMLLLFLTSMFSAILTAKGGDIRRVEGPSTRAGSEGPTNGPASYGEIVPSQSEKEKPQGQSRDAWDFSNFTKWSSLAYANGNKTRLIVGVNSSNTNSITLLESIAARHQVEIVSRVNISRQVSAIVVEISYESMSAFVEDIRETGFASYVEPNLKVQSQFTPNDPYWSLQWGPQKIQADWAWNVTKGFSSVLVAVVDTGVDYTHPDLSAN